MGIIGDYINKVKSRPRMSQSEIQNVAFDMVTGMAGGARMKPIKGSNINYPLQTIRNAAKEIQSPGYLTPLLGKWVKNAAGKLVKVK